MKTILKNDRHQDGQNMYKVTSIYFDDYGDHFLRDTEDGSADRVKYRLRIYNDSFETIKAEVKQKHDNRVLKQSDVITEAQMRDLMEGRYLAEEAMQKEGALSRFHLAGMISGIRPKVIVEYDRSAYIYEAGNVRITIDRNIRASLDFDAFLNHDKVEYEMVRENRNVLEVKYDAFLPGFIARVLESGTMQQESCSKYRLCRMQKDQWYA